MKKDKNEQNRSKQNKLGQSHSQKSEKKKRFKSTQKTNNDSLSVIFVSAPLQSNFVKISMLGKSIDTLVDTGSSLSCIQKSLLNTFDQDLVIYGPSQYKKVKGIGGHLINVSDTIILPVQIGNQLFTQKFHVFDEILHPLLLSIDFLKDNNYALDLEKQTIDSDHGTPVVNLLSTKPCANTGLTQPIKHTIIQPHSEMLIQCTNQNIKGSTPTNVPI